MDFGCGSLAHPSLWRHFTHDLRPLREGV